MINSSNYPNHLLNRLSIDPNKENYQISFEHDIDFDDFLSDCMYESGIIRFALEVNFDKKTVLDKKLNELVVQKFLDDLNITDKSKLETEVSIKSWVNLFAIVDFDWSSFVKDRSSLYSSDDTYDITDYVKIVDYTIYSVSIDCEFNIDGKNYNYLNEKIDDVLDLRSYGIVFEDVLKNREWLFNHPTLFTEMPLIKQFKLTHLKET